MMSHQTLLRVQKLGIIASLCMIHYYAFDVTITCIIFLSISMLLYNPDVRQNLMHLIYNIFSLCNACVSQIIWNAVHGHHFYFNGNVSGYHSIWLLSLQNTWAYSFVCRQTSLYNSFV